MPPPLDPAAHPALIDLGARLRELAGDAAYAAGRDYLRKGLVRDGTVAGEVAQAAVAGSTDYRVTVAFGSAPKVSCTCPAHRRNRHCKHVVAVCLALLERPAEFRPVEPTALPAPPAPRRKRGGAAETKTAREAERRAGQQAAGLAVVDRLLAELAAGGVAGLGKEQADLLATAAETVRGLKLRRLGNLLLALRTLVGAAGGEVDPRRFAGLLTEIALVRQTVGAHLAGRIALDPALAEDLLGRTWRETELERVSGLDLIPLADTRHDDGEFRVATTYFADLPTGAIFAEKQITPLALRATPRPDRRHRLLVAEAGLYPGPPPRRLKLIAARPAPLTLDHIERLVAHGIDNLAELRLRLIDRLREPFAPPELAVLVQPRTLLRRGDALAALDADGHRLDLDWPAARPLDLATVLPEDAPYALFGLLRLAGAGLRLTCLAAIGSLRWGRGPIYPDRGR